MTDVPITPLEVHALAKMAKAAAKPKVETPGQLLREIMPDLRVTGFACPASVDGLSFVQTQAHRSIGQFYLSSVIIHLNDDHAWTREQVADWIETLDVDLRFPGAS
jgi:hypothetical protein